MAWWKKKARPTPEMLRSASSERDVVSCNYGADLKGRGMIFKFALRNGQSDVIDIAPTLALDIAGDIESSARRFKYVDVRYEGGTDRQIAAIDDFKKCHPILIAADWNVKNHTPPAAPVRCEAHAFIDFLFLEFQYRNYNHKVFKLDPTIVFYLSDAVRDAQRSGMLPWPDLGTPV